MIGGRVALREVVQQGFEQVRGQFLEQLQKTIEGLLVAERDRRVTQLCRQGQKVYRWGYTVRKCWQTLWGALQQVRGPRLRGHQQFGLLEKEQHHSLEQVLFGLAVSGLSQRKVVGWVRCFLGSTLSPATLTRVLAEARQQVQARRQAIFVGRPVRGPGGGWDSLALWPPAGSGPARRSAAGGCRRASQRQLPGAGLASRRC